MMGLLRKPKEVDEVAIARAIERSARAEALAKDDAFVDAVAKVEGFYVEAWRKSDPLDVDARERAWIATKLLEDIRASIIATVREGVVAQKQLERSLRSQ
jgi:hypothetical protein